MTNTPWMGRTLMLVTMMTMLGVSTAAFASVDTSPAPGGVYKLKPGIYVARDSSCEAPANAAIREYDGRGLGTAHSRSCKASVLARKGSRFTVSQRCIDSGAGPGRRQVQRQQVSVHDALTFTQTIGASATTYRYCPAYQLPRELRRAPR